MRHSAYKRETYTFINANIKVQQHHLEGANIKVQTLFIKIFLTLFAIQLHSWTTLGWIRQTLMRLYNQLSINRFSIKQYQFPKNWPEFLRYMV